MKKFSLAIMLCISCLFSFSFAANRTNKYQAIKEGGEYYNQLQEIYQNENFQSRHNTAVSECKRNQDLCFKNSNIYTAGNCLEIICTTQSLGMTEEEEKIYNYVENQEAVSEWAIKDNQCYQSMNGYYDEKEDKCLCEDGFHIENNICVKDDVIEETKIEENDQAKTVEEIKNNVNETELKRAKQCLGDKTVFIESIAEVYKKKDTRIQNNVKKLVDKFKVSKDEYTRSIGIYLSSLIE